MALSLGPKIGEFSLQDVSPSRLLILLPDFIFRQKSNAKLNEGNRLNIIKRCREVKALVQ